MSAGSDPDHVGTVPHEVRGTVVWNQWGLSPYWALGQLIDAADGGGWIDVSDRPNLDVERVQLSYYESGISPRPEDDLHQLHEYQVYWETPDGDRFGGAIKPRFEAEKFRKQEDGTPFYNQEKISVPKDLGQAVAWDIKAGKYEYPSYYTGKLPILLSVVADELGTGWNPEYFASQPHEYSSLTDLEATVRYTRGAAKKVTQRGGILYRLFELLADMEGNKWEYSGDDSEIQGYIHQVRMDSDSHSELFPTGRRRGIQLKSYYPREVLEDEDDPLYNPRFGALFKKKWNDNTAVPWNQWEDLYRELEETLINVLSWSGVPIEPDPTTYVEDPYWSVETSDLDVGLYQDPTPEIETSQESILVKTLSTALDQDVEKLETLVADGGEVHYQELADEANTSVSSIYRALDRLGDIVESDNGVIRLQSEHIRQKLMDVLDPLQEEVKAKTEAIANLLNIDRQRLERKGSALQEWLAEYAADIRETSSGKKIDIRTKLTRKKSTNYPRIQDVLLEGYQAWRDAGLSYEDFLNASVKWQSSEMGLDSESGKPKNILSNPQLARE